MRIDLDGYTEVTVTVTTKPGGKYSGNVHSGGLLIGSVSGKMNAALRGALPVQGVTTERLQLTKSGNQHYVTFEGGGKMEVLPIA